MKKRNFGFEKILYKGQELEFNKPVKSGIFTFLKQNPSKINMKIVRLMRRMANVIEGK